jgi:von Willebrand factor type A domain
MHLERATSRSGQAALAGWISSNDVTLFTTVLVMAIAMFLHARLTKGQKENQQITHEKTALAARLAATAGELDASLGRLDETRQTLQLTQEERDALRQQLVEKLDAIVELNAKLDEFVKQKGQLDSQRKTLLASQESLTREKAELVARQVSLVGDRDSLKVKTLDLREQLESIARELADKIAALEEIASERDRLKRQADELDAIVVGLKQRLEKTDLDAAELRKSATAEQWALQKKLQVLEKQLAARDQTLGDYLSRLKRATESLEELAAENTQLERRISDTELKRQAALVEEGRNNRELIGLTGRLEKVAILFDASGSMRQVTSGGNDRWAEAQEIAAKWLQHLSVQECVLIVFSSEVRTFPDDGSLADLRGGSGKAKRDALLQHVKSVSPAGSTNTYQALRKAYEYDLDAILLFSDGAPSETTAGAFDPAAAKKIYDLCRSHPHLPIHTIGLGNYFDKNASTFLMSLAKITGGTFRGQ